MVEVKGNNGDEINCDSCSLKADVIQYCIDSEIGPFNKFSLKNLYHDREVNLAAYLSFLQIIVVVVFAIVTLSFSHGLYQYWLTIITFVAIILIVSGLTHYILAKSNKIVKRNDVKGAFYLAYRCISDEHEPVLLTSADSLSHMYKGSSHNTEQLKFNIYTTTYIRSSFDYFLFIFVPLWSVTVARFFIINEQSLYALYIVLFATLVALIMLRLVPNRKKDVDLVKFNRLMVLGNFYIISISLFLVSSYTFRKFTSHLDVNKLCYIPFESNRNGRIYLIESISDSFIRGVKKIKFVEDNEEIFGKNVFKLISKRSLAKWQDAIKREAIIKSKIK